MYRKIYLLLGLLFISYWLQAQSKSSSITGILREDSGEPAAFVAVVLLNQDSALVKAEVSEADGTFKFQQLKAGSYRIATSSLQFQPFITQPFEVKEEETKTLGVIALATLVTELKAVQVVGARPMVEVHPDKAVFNIQGTINSAGNDAIDLLSRAPGVIMDNNDNLVVMGKSGVIVYIDGRRSQLRGDDLIAFLRSLRSENIDAIEIITNPSAKYDAEGNAGIINIRMKRDANLGFNGSVVAGYSIDLHSRYNSGLTLNYREKKYSLFGSYSFYDNTGEGRFNLTRSQNGFLIENRSTNLWNNTGHSIRAGGDYYLNKNHTIGILFNGSYVDRGNFSFSRSPISNEASGETNQILVASNDLQFDIANTQANFNYQYRGNKGSTLNVDLDYGYYTSDGTGYQPNVYYDGSGQAIDHQNANRNDRDTEINIRSVKADYETKLGKGSLGAGFKFSSVTTHNVFDFYDQSEDEFIKDETRSNIFDYTEEITAGYINYSIKLGQKFLLNSGLRSEYTHSIGDLTSQQDNPEDYVSRTYLNFFPNIGLTYEINKKNKVGASFTRRIDRPNYQSLNPFEFQLDELTFQRGNPFLQPQYTNIYQVTYSGNSRLNAILSYSFTDNYSAQVIDSTGVRGTMLKPQNVGTSKNTALNISYPVDITKWWNARGNINTYYSRFDAVLNEQDFSLDVVAYNISMQNTFTLPNFFKVELSAWYNSPSIWGGTFKTGHMWSSTLGIRKTVWKNGQLTASLRDVFNTERWNGSSDYNGIRTDGGGRGNFRRFIVGFSYRFGNQKVRAARNRATGLEDEKGRIGDN
jgi:iron complex outermembrane recepter protein